MYERDLKSFKQIFPITPLGNLMRFMEGLKSYIRDKESVDLSPTSAVIVEKTRSPEGPPRAKKFRSIDRIDQSASDLDWFDKVKKYMLYFDHEGENEAVPGICACALSPTIAVTFAHGSNTRFWLRVTDFEGKVEKQGSILKLYSLYKNQEINADVVLIDSTSDLLILEALDGKTFFDGDEMENILEDPVEGMKLLAIGLSSSTSLQEAVTTGVIRSPRPLANGHMVSDMIKIPWAGHSGGGVFSPNNKLLGIITSSEASDDEAWTRTSFSSGAWIRAAWEAWMVESGKMAEHRGLRRSDE